MGVAAEEPGKSLTHFTPLDLSKDEGSSSPDSAEPLKLGPRQLSQSPNAGKTKFAEKARILSPVT